MGKAKKGGEGGAKWPNAYKHEPCEQGEQKALDKSLFEGCGHFPTRKLLPWVSKSRSVTCRLRFCAQKICLSRIDQSSRLLSEIRRCGSKKP